MTQFRGLKVRQMTHKLESRECAASVAKDAGAKLAKLIDGYALFSSHDCLSWRWSYEVSVLNVAVSGYLTMRETTIIASAVLLKCLLISSA